MNKAIPAFTSIYLKKKKIDMLQNHKKLMTKNEKRIGGKKVENIFLLYNLKMYVTVWHVTLFMRKIKLQQKY